MKKMALAVLLLLGVAVSPMAQTINLDMDTEASGVQNAVTVSPGQEFQVYLVVEEAVNMTGVSADLVFDATNLELVSIREVPGDLNFDGLIDLNREVVEIVNQFVAEFNFEVGDNTGFTDGYGRQSAVVYDVNNDTFTDLNAEVIPVINQFIDEFNFEPAVYWTQDVMNQTPAANNESVEIFDPVAKSNTGGEHPGLVDDMTSVLLARPDRTEDFGFNGTGVIATITFQAKSTAAADTYDFSFPEAVWIDNGFEDLNDVENLTTPGTAPSVTVQ